MESPGQFWLPSLEPARQQRARGRQLSIEADCSEEPSGVPALLRQAGAAVRSLRLPAGDYLVEHRVLVERKAAGDFAGSLFDGRLFRQIAYLKNAPMSALLVIEGCGGFYESFWPARMRTALLAVAADYRVPALFTRKPEGTADLLLTLAERCAGRMSWEHFEPSHRRRSLGGRARRLAEDFERLRSLPGIGTRLSTRLLGEFQSLKNLRTADERTLAAVKGIGGKKARRLLEALRGCGG